VNDEITAHKTGHCRSRARWEGTGRHHLRDRGQDSKSSRSKTGGGGFRDERGLRGGTGSFLESRRRSWDQHQGRVRAAGAVGGADAAGRTVHGVHGADVTGWMTKAKRREHRGRPGLLDCAELFERVVRGRRIGRWFYFQGGTAYNDSVAALRQPAGQEDHGATVHGVIGPSDGADRRQWREATGARAGSAATISRSSPWPAGICLQACSNLCDIKDLRSKAEELLGR